MKKSKKVYRIALYGLSSSGKTCLLAALAMPRYPHALGYTCIWRAIEVNKPKHEVGKHNHYLIKLNRSKEWMTQAIENLSALQLPPPNETNDQQFVFEYDFTASTHQTFRAELTDYSGELINPKVSRDQLAKDMRKKIMDMDGIVVLAEAPFRDKWINFQNEKDCHDHTYTDLYPLRQAFSLLRCENQTCAALDVPIALVITKWDRYSDIDYITHATEQRKLEEFMNASTPPPHKGLQDVLCYSVTKGNFKVFPVSGLGACECTHLEQGRIERPKQVNPLNAFGLEDPFIWLAQRRDAIDLQNYQEQSQSIIFPRCKETGLDLLNRFPKASKESKEIKKLLQACQRSKKLRTLYITLGIVVFWLMAETTLDIKSYQQHVVAANNEHAGHQELEHAEKWLTNYISAPYYRHLISNIFLSREEVEKLLTDVQNQRETFLWGPVEEALAVNLSAALSPAQTYLKYYPYGPHAKAAHDIKLRSQIQLAQRQYEDQLRKIAFVVQKEVNNPKRLSELLDVLRELPYDPEAETDSLRQERLALEQQVSDQLTYLKDQQDWEQFIHQIDQVMQTGNFLAAGQLLSRHPADKRLNRLKETFKTVVMQNLEKQVSMASSDQLDQVTEYLKAYAQLPEDLKSPVHQSQVSAWQHHIYERQDEILYEAARTQLDIKHIDQYLQKAPLKSMAKEIHDYKVYLESISGVMLNQLRLKLAQIQWENIKDNNNTVTVLLNARQVIKNNKVNAEPHTSSNLIGISSEFSAKPSDILTIEIKVINKDFFFDDDYGYVEAEIALSELAEASNGYKLTLRTEQGVKTGTAFIEIENYPQEPLLPVWDKGA
jgi:GTPase SAR1 family protein